MDNIIEKIILLKDDIENFKIIEDGKVFSKESFSSVKNYWLHLCIFEDKYLSILSELKCIAGISSTIIANVNHTECIQILNSLLIHISNVHILKNLEEFCDVTKIENERTLDIIYAMQCFKMKKNMYQLKNNLSSLLETLKIYKKDIEIWIKDGTERICRKSSMHS